jgi:hypothetical protein
LFDMRHDLRLLAATAVLILLAGCPSANSPSNNDNGGIDVVNDDNGGNSNGTTAVSLSGRLAPGMASKSIPRSQTTMYPYTIVAQSNDTGEIYRTQTDETGDFSLDLPAAEQGNTFVVTILGPDGKAVGPVLFGSDGTDGYTGVTMDRAASLGVMALPDDPTAAAITPGEGADTADLANPDVPVVLNGNGAPVGLATHGKGADVGTGHPAKP